MKRSSMVICALAVLGTALLAAPRANGQGAPAGPLQPDPGVKPEPLPPPDKNRIRVQANEVVAPVTVTDKSGEMLLSLKESDFHVFEDGVEQKIQHFGLGGEPLSIVIVLEKSARIEPLMPTLHKAGIVFAQPVMGQTAEAAVVAYDDSAELLQKFTTNPEAIESAIRTLRLGNYDSHLYDAMNRGISLLEEQPQGQRRVMLVVGEAQDTGSDSKLGEVLRHAQVANVTIYSVGLSTTSAKLRAKPSDAPAPLPPVPTGNPRDDEMQRQMQSGADLAALAIFLIETGKNAIGPNSLAVASKSTGGLHLNSFKDRSIEKAVDAIGGELHAQYTIGYQPGGNKEPGYHEIRVTVDKPGTTLRTRPGYYLADSDDLP